MGFVEAVRGKLVLPAWEPPPIPIASSRVSAQLSPSGWRLKGFFVGRVWLGDLPETEYQLLLLAGNRNHLRHSDRYTRDGMPIYVLSDYERRAGEKLLDARCHERFESHNVACNAGRAALLNYLSNAGGLTGVQYFAVGIGSPVIPNATDTQLVSEFFRKQITTATVSGNTMNLVTTFLTTEANTTYTEAGCFGDGATGTANSGQLFDHAPYPYTKTSSVTLSNQATLSLN